MIIYQAIDTLINARASTNLYQATATLAVPISYVPTYVLRLTESILYRLHFNNLYNHCDFVI